MVDRLKNYNNPGNPPHYGTVSQYIRVVKVREDEYYERSRQMEGPRQRLSRIIRTYGYILDSYRQCPAFDGVRDAIYNKLFLLEENTYMHLSRRVALTRDGRRLNVNIAPGTNRIIPSKLIEQLYKNQFYDPGVLQFIQCSLNRMFHNNSLNSLSQFWLHNIKRIGEPSKYGRVVSGEVGGYSEMVVFKSASRDELVNIIKYEAIIGHEVNKLRRQGIINFMYTYGIITCKNLHFCKSREYLLMQEYIKGSTYKRVIATISPTELMSTIFQLIFALRMAYKEMEYRHCDLHRDNVIVRDGPESMNYFYIPYQWGDRTVYVRSTKIATIIDYGRSSVRMNDDGNSEVIYSGKFFASNPENTNKLGDIFTLLATIHHTIRHSVVSQEIRDIVEELLYFFVDVSQLDEYPELESQWTSTYFPLYSRYPAINFKLFISYIRRNKILSPYWNQLITFHPESNRVLLCTDNCVNPDQITPQSTDTVAGVLDYVIRANEYWPGQVEDWDKLIDEIVYFLASHDSRQILGMRILLSKAMDNIPIEYHHRLNRYLR